MKIARRSLLCPVNGEGVTRGPLVGTQACAMDEPWLVTIEGLAGNVNFEDVTLRR
jgi:hypothetical protein